MLFQRQTMIPQSSLKCPSCHLYFAFQNTPKLLKHCNHSICILCLQTVQNCPIDGQNINLNKWGLKSFLTNTKILQQIQNQNYSYSNVNNHNQEPRFSFSTKAKHENNNLFSQTFALNQKSSKWQLCQIHMKKADFISKQDFKIVCESCISAKTSEKLKFMSYEELLKKLTDLTDKTYKIYENINKKSQQYSKKYIHSFIEQQVSKKRQKQSYQIRGYFQNLIQEIRKQEKHALQRLDEVSRQTVKNLKTVINLEGFHKKKQQWTQQVQKLIAIMQTVYDWNGFEKAFEYVKNERKKQFLLDQGYKIQQESSQMDEKVNQIVKMEMKNLQCKFDERLLKGIYTFYGFGGKIQSIQTHFQDYCIQSVSNRKQQVFEKPLPILKITHLFSENLCLKNQKPKLTIEPIFSLKLSFSSDLSLQKEQKQQKYQYPQNSIMNHADEKLQSSSEQDFLLDTQKSLYPHNQTLTKNEITFEENFSLLDHDAMPTREEFTPILRKQEQDSMSVLQDESTIMKIDHSKKHQQQENHNILAQTKSEDITIEIRPSKLTKINRNVLISPKTISNSSVLLSRTFVPHSLHKSSCRSPLKSLDSNLALSCSAKKKLGIPEKYLSMWQSAKYDAVEVIDFTGAQIGDDMTLQLATHLAESKRIKSVKLIRNKLTDEIIPDLIQRLVMSNTTSLNLSQNLLTERTLANLQKMNLGNLKSITLSLNKIILRKVKDRIEKFKERGITVTV